MFLNILTILKYQFFNTFFTNSGDMILCIKKCILDLSKKKDEFII